MSASGPSSAPPGGRSFSASSSEVAGPATTSAPRAIPTAAAGAATRSASAAYPATTPPGVNPSARRTPSAGSRRWTSACAPAASIVPAATSATSANAVSSAITTPAAWSRISRTPVRVTKRRLPSPNATVRACASVIAVRARSLSHSSATLAGKSSRSPGNAACTSSRPTYTRAVRASG